MGSAFNSQILVEKLAKLNSSQASIETLSHWCIFHLNKAKQVVETWARQFHSAPREQRLVFLYLANDILQNSRRKGPDFVGEFWKVLPEALRDVIHNGDDSGRRSAMRLINIWEERKVFGSRGQLLKEEFQGRQMESTKKKGNDLELKMKPSVGNTADKIVLGYQMANGPQIDEDVSSKCQNAIAYLEKMEKEIGSHSNSEKLLDPAFAEELRSQNGILSTCIEHLTTIESSRTRLVSQLRESLQEQELKLDQVRNLLQSARARSEQTKKLCAPPLINGSNNIQMMSNQSSIDTTVPSYSPLESIKEQSAPLIMYTNSTAGSSIQTSGDDPRKSAAAAMAAKLTASSSSAQMLSYVLSSLASEAMIGRQDSPPPQKRPKLETDLSLPTCPPQLPPQSTMASFSMPPPPLPLLQSPAVQLNYVPQVVLQPPLEYTPVRISGSLPAFTAPPDNSFQGFSGAAEGSFYGHQPSIPTAPVSRQ